MTGKEFFNPFRKVYLPIEAENREKLSPKAIFLKDLADILRLIEVKKDLAALLPERLQRQLVK